MIGDIGYWTGCLIGAGLSVYIAYRIFAGPDFIDRVFKDPEIYALFVVVPWALGWGFRCIFTPYLGIRLMRPSAWENDWRRLWKILEKVFWQIVRGNDEEESEFESTGNAKIDPIYRYVAHAFGVKGRLHLHVVESIIIGCVLAFGNFVMWEDNVFIQIMVAIFWMLAVAGLIVIIDGTILYLALFKFMDNRRIAQSAVPISVAGTLIFVYFRLRHHFV
jgi:hypothetical protein